MEIILIAAVTADGYIARHSAEKITWSKDLMLFKKQTMGYDVIVGSNTFNTLYKPLEGRNLIVYHREINPEDILNQISAKKCFVAGGGKTNAQFAPYLTHLYLTHHPVVFGNGVSLFNGLETELTLEYKATVPVLPEAGIYQVQYRIKRDNCHTT